MTTTTKTKGRKTRAHEQTCYCSAYGFPHRLNGGSCKYSKRGSIGPVAKHDEDEEQDCGDCMGTGIGWGGPDSSCSSCGGSGMPRRPRYRARPGS